MFAVLRKNCKRLLTLLLHQKQRSDVSPDRQIARQQLSSSFKLKYLSPASVVKERKAMQTERPTDKAKLAKLADDSDMIQSYYWMMNNLINSVMLYQELRKFHSI